MPVASLSPVNLEIGGDKVEYCVYVALLQDDMFLGIDFSFIQRWWVKLHLYNSVMI